MGLLKKLFGKSIKEQLEEEHKQIEEQLKIEEESARKSYEEDFKQGKQIVKFCIGENFYSNHSDVLFELAEKYGYERIDKTYDDYLPVINLVFRKVKAKIETWQCPYCQTVNPNSNFQCLNCGAKRTP